MVAGVRAKRKRHVRGPQLTLAARALSGQGEVMEGESTHRDVCWRCRRPRRVCWCDAVRPVESQTRVVFVQHPRETRVPISTCRMAHLSLPNSELHVGLSAVGNPRLERLCAEADVAVLFPSADAVDVGALERPPRTLVVVDGTWSNAKKVVERCPLLSKLPRVSFTPERPGAYRIRKEPAEHCLSTIEAVTYVLERLERAPGRFTPLLGVFDAMVEGQLGFIASNERQSRHRFTRRRNSVPVDPLEALAAEAGKLVVFFGEANAWPLDRPDRPPGKQAELVQLVAQRISTGESFGSLLLPARALGPTVAFHLGLEPEALLTAPPRDEVLNRWRRFISDDDVLVGWGTFCRSLLTAEGLPPPRFVNLRGVVAQLLGRRAGSVESWAEQHGFVLPKAGGRAARRLAALRAVLQGLLDGAIPRVLSGAERESWPSGSAPTERGLSRPVGGGVVRQESAVRRTAEEHDR